MEVEDLEIIKLEPKHIDQVFEYFIQEFSPDEPLFQSFQFFEGDGFFDRLLAKDVKKLIMEEPILAGDSFGAFDKEGNLLGIRLGKIAVKGNLPKEPKFGWILNIPEFLVPKKLLLAAYASKFFEYMEYSVEQNFVDCQDNNGRIYTGMSLGVARRGRGKGLGDKLLKKSLEYAREQNCSHSAILATGIYSQRIIRNNGFQLVKEKPYDGFKDKHGNQVIKHEVHKSCQLLVLKLWQFGIISQIKQS